MINHIAFKMVGPYHNEVGIPCQDSFFVFDNKEEEITIAAVADGLGSEKYSDIGSKIASKVAVENCATNYKKGMHFNEAKKIMNNAYVYAYRAILEEADKAGNPDDQYDTTLALAIYDGTHLFYGQSGDSGIIALLSNGHYVRVTRQQRDDEGRVYPLCFGPTYWEFGEVSEDVSSVMLMTDGVWAEIAPPVIDDHEQNVNVNLAMRFMDRDETEDEEVKAVENQAVEFMQSYRKDRIDDDKTIVVLYNTNLHAQRLTDEYYSPLDWESLNKEYYAANADNSDDGDGHGSPEEENDSRLNGDDNSEKHELSDIADVKEANSGSAIVDLEVQVSNCSNSTFSDSTSIGALSHFNLGLRKMFDDIKVRMMRILK